MILKKKALWKDLLVLKLNPVPNVFFNTNNVPIEVEDVANKGATSENTNILDKPTQFPTAISDLDYRLNDTGGAGPTMPDLKKSVDRLSSRLN